MCVDSKSKRDPDDFLMIQRPWAVKVEEILKKIEVDPKEGLSIEEKEKRKRRYGPNELKKAEKKSAFSVFIEQFKSVLVILLTAAVAVSFLFNQVIEGIAILAVIVINTIFHPASASRSDDIGTVQATMRRSTLQAFQRRAAQVGSARFPG
ncbi:MAG: cation-transporting P-type ATPase [Thermoplasmata archaeon]